MTDLSTAVGGTVETAPTSSIVSETGDEIHARHHAAHQPEPDSSAPEAEPKANAEQPAEDKPEDTPKAKRDETPAWMKREIAKEREARRQLEAELAALRAGQQAPQPAKDPQAPQQMRDPNGEPNPDDYPGGRFDPDYLSDRADWAGTQAFARWQNQQTEHQRESAYRAREEAVAAQLPDYRDAVNTLPPVLRDPPDILRPVLMDSDVAPILKYQLAQEPEIVDELLRMPTTQAIARLGVYEHLIRQSLTGARSVEQQPQQPPREPEAVKAPEPWKPGGGAPHVSALERAERTLNETGDATAFLNARRKSR